MSVTGTLTVKAVNGAIHIEPTDGGTVRMKLVPPRAEGVEFDVRSLLALSLILEGIANS